MNGRAKFHLVNLNEAIVDERDVLGPEGDGWAVTRTFLTCEKNSFDLSAHGGCPFGTVDLGGRAGDLAALVGGTGGVRGNRGVARRLQELVQAYGLSGDPAVRQDLARLHTYRAIMGYTNLRARSSSVPGLEGPTSKLTVSTITRLQRELGLRVQGAYGTLVGKDSRAADFQDFALSSPATSIAGGADEIQRNHLAERVLGLPREPAPDQDVPFRDVPHGAARWS